MRNQINWENRWDSQPIIDQFNHQSANQINRVCRSECCRWCYMYVCSWNAVLPHRHVKCKSEMVKGGLNSSKCSTERGIRASDTHPTHSSYEYNCQRQEGAKKNATKTQPQTLNKWDLESRDGLTGEFLFSVAPPPKPLLNQQTNNKSSWETHKIFDQYN